MSSRAAPLLPWPPRGLRREEAARYVGISPSKFEQLVRDGRMPQPREIDGCRVWDRMSLDVAFDDLPHVGEKPQPAGNPFDEATA